MSFVDRHTDIYLKFLERLMHLMTYHQVIGPELGGYAYKYSQWMKKMKEEGREDFIKWAEQYRPLLTMTTDDSSLLDLFQGFTLKSITSFIPYYIGLLFIFAKTTFDNYINDLIKNIYLVQINCLKSERMLTYEKILSYTNIHELKNYMIDRECEKVSRMDYKKKISYIQDTFSLDLTNIIKVEKSMVKYCEIRNILVHNDGIINETYLIKTGDDNYESGDEIIIDDPLLASAIELFTEIVTKIDETAHSKFNLPTFTNP